jgi:hypothetical protein
MKILKGLVKFTDIGIGTWELITKDGDKYELIGDESRFKDGKKAVLKGKIRKDLMSSGNAGPIFEVESTEMEKE